MVWVVGEVDCPAPKINSLNSKNSITSLLAVLPHLPLAVDAAVSQSTACHSDTI